MNIIDRTIIILGVINFFRLTILTTLTVIYDSFLLKKQIRKRHHKAVYYKPLVSVVIAAYNEEKVIQRTLTYLFKSTYTNFEVIVVNDGSKDNTEQEVKDFMAKNPDKKVIYVYQPNQGKAHALNNAILNHVNGKLMMCLDADSLLREDALEKAVPYFRNRNTKALATNVKIMSDNSVLGLIQEIEYLMGYHLKKALTVGNIEYIIGGVGSVFRTSIVKKLGGYDTDTITEDIDLTMKVVRLGNRKNLLVYAEDVVVFTEGTLTVHALFKQRFRWKFGRFQTFWKNRDLFFNSDKKYSKFLTWVYLPFQLFSEFTFLFDPIFILYILVLALRLGDASSYFGMFLFMMFYVAMAVATDYQSSTKHRIMRLLLTPFSYLFFLLVSVVEYVGLINCILRWREIIYAKDYNRCGWTPVARLGNNNVKLA